MISQMDQIYGNAFFTIIAATGDDAQTHLPRVSKAHLRPQREINTRDTTLLELPDGSEDVYSSKWAPKGRTYQEYYLSTRRLIVTFSQVLFLCNGLCVRESVKVLLNNHSFARRTRPFSRSIPRFNLSGRSSSAPGLLKSIFGNTPIDSSRIILTL